MTDFRPLPVRDGRRSAFFVLVTGLTLLSLSFLARSGQAQPTLVGETFTTAIESGAPLENVGSPEGLCFSARAALPGRNGVCYDGSSVDPITTAPRRPSEFTRFDGDIYFRGFGPGGQELYKYDGTTSSLVADINSSGGSRLSELTLYDDGSGTESLYFAADDGTHGTELWRYEAGGTASRLTDINPSGDARPQELTVHDGDLYFSARDGTNGRELWRYEADGSVVRLSDINTSGSPGPEHLTVYTDNGSSGTDLYFSATDGTNGRELWAFEGGGAPVRLTDLNPSGDSRPKDLTVYDDGGGADLYFSATDGSGRELWRYNADGSTSRRTNLSSSGGFDPKSLAVYDDGSGPALYFSANVSGDRELWRYNADGTTDGLSDINSSGDSNPESLTVYNDGSGAGLYFTADDGRIRSVWKYDGSVSQLTTTKNLVGGPGQKVVYDGTLYFAGRDVSSGTELWSYDGSTIQQVRDINPGYRESSPTDFTVYDDGEGADLYFSADNGSDGQELFQYDGFGTGQVDDIRGGADGAQPEGLTVYDDGGSSGADLYFTANDGSDGRELWRYESGNSASQVVDVNPSGTSRANFLAVYDDGGASGADLYFAADGGSDGQELWRYDSGSSASQVADINNGSLSGSNPRGLTVYNGILYFIANDGSTGRELWAFNGSTTTRITDINGGSGSSLSFSTKPIVYDGKLYFPGYDGSEWELWRYDASDGSVRRVVDINGSRSAFPRSLIVYNNRLYFTARTASTGREPHAWDGSTLHQAEGYPGRLSGGGGSPAVYDDGTGKKLYVTATNGSSGRELYEFDKQSPPLPVELASFEATQTAEAAVRLSWTTASEQNNAGFRVERRREADRNGDTGKVGEWEKVGYVSSAAPGGTSDQAQSYTFRVETLPVGQHRFRLKQVDLDGSTHVHDAVSVEVGMSEPVQLSGPVPNPVRGDATVSFAVKEAGETTITLYNTLGQRVRTVYRGTPAAGERQTVDLRAENLPSGAYFVRIRSGPHTRAQRLTIVR